MPQLLSRLLRLLLPPARFLETRPLDPARVIAAVPGRLTTERLELRRDAVEDAEQIYEAIEASRPELTRWLEWATPDFDFQEALSNQQTASRCWSAGFWFQWRIWRRDPEAQAPHFLGSIDLHTIDWNGGHAQLGYWLDSRATGHGYLTEAARAVVELAFTLGFSELRIVCHRDNTRSIAVAHRLHFRPSFIDSKDLVCLVRRRPR